MRIENRRVTELKPYAKNTKLHDKKQIENVAASIRRFGWQQPIVIDEAGVVVIGHCRLEAAKKLGMQEVPCTVASGLTDEEIRELRIADNKTNESPWDVETLKAEMVDLSFEGFDFDFGLEEPEREVVEDEYDKPAPECPVSKLGQVYALGEHRLMVGDSTKLEDVAKLMGGEKADMLLTDPPYNVDYKGMAGKIKNDSMKDAEFREFLNAAFCCAKESMKPGAAFHIWHADVEGYNFRGAAKDAGLLVRQCLIWVKNSLVLGRQDFQWKHEPCLYGENPVDYPGTAEMEEDGHAPCLYGWVDGKHYWFKNRRQTTVLQFDRPTKSKEHPTMKPVKMFAYEIECNTKAGEKVLDLFAGSGTTLIAAEQTGRQAYVMEFDPKYADVIIDRWETFTGRKAQLLED